MENKLTNEPAFRWWVPYTIKKRDVIISSVKVRVQKTTHKYGIEVFSTIEQAKAIDEANNNTFQSDAIEKEMVTILPALDVLPDGSTPPLGYIKSSGHLVFDVKMDFTRKARWGKMDI